MGEGLSQLCAEDRETMDLCACKDPPRRWMLSGGNHHLAHNRRLGTACAFRIWQQLSGKMHMDPLLRVDGWLAVEVFSGCSVVSMGCLAHGVPACVPWDCEADKRLNVLDNGWVLTRLVRAERIKASTFAHPCRSQSMCRLSL